MRKVVFIGLFGVFLQFFSENVYGQGTADQLLQQAQEASARGDYPASDSLYSLAANAVTPAELKNQRNFLILVEALENRYRFRDYAGTVYLADSCFTLTEQARAEIPEIQSDLLRIKGDALSRQRDNNGALQARMQALSLIEGNKDALKKIAQLSLDIGFSHVNHSLDYDLAEAFILKALAINKSLGDSLAIVKTLNDLGILYYRTSQRVKSLKCYLEGLSHAKEEDAFFPIIVRINFGLGRYYREALNPETSAYYFEQAFTMAKHYIPNDPVIFNIAREYMLTLKDLGKFDKAIDIASFPIQPEDRTKSRHRQIAEGDLYLEIGRVQIAKGDYKEAEKTLLTTLEKYELGRSHVVIDNAYPMISLADLYLKTGENTKAKRWLFAAGKQLKESPAYTHVDYANLRMQEAEILSKLGYHSEALSAIDSAMIAIHYTPWQNENFEDITHYKALSDILQIKTSILEAIHADDISSSVAALENQYFRQLRFLEFICLQNLDPAVRLYILEHQYSVFERALRFLSKQYAKDRDLETFNDMLNIAGQGRDQALKAYLLRNSLFRSIQTLPESSMDEIQHIQSALADIALYEFSHPERAASKIREKQKLTLALDKANATLLEASGYMNFDSTYSRRDLLSALHREQKTDISTAYLEFFVGEQESYAFLILTETVELFILESGNEIRDAVQQCRDNLTRPSPDFNSYEDCGAVYGIVREPLEAAVKSGYGHLVIIPHDAMYSIPFEIFTTLENQQEDHTLQQPVVSYANSITSLLDVKFNNRLAVKNAAFFAPVYEDLHIQPEDTTGAESFALLVRSGAYRLPGAEREVEEIHETYGGDRYIGHRATKAAFEKVAAQYNILHLSMHALLEEMAPQYSRLLFTQDDATGDYQLFAAELNNMQLNANLAVLSACNTGAGKIAKGEGIQSLSKSFQYAGVPSVVHSLWKVPDDATAELMVHFYSYLSEGRSKAEALHLAKKAYLNDAVDPQLTHPYYWAGFVLTGNADPVPTISASNNIQALPIFLVVIIVLGILAVILLRRSSTREGIAY